MQDRNMTDSNLVDMNFTNVRTFYRFNTFFHANKLLLLLVLLLLLLQTGNEGQQHTTNAVGLYRIIYRILIYSEKQPFNHQCEKLKGSWRTCYSRHKPSRPV